MSKNFCNQCGECCRNIPVDFENQLVFFDGIQPLNEDFKSLLIPVSKTKNITFCSCKYLLINKCTNPNRPEMCTNYPSSPFAYIKEGCGFYGEIFSKLEHIKQKIRKLKEEIISYESLPVIDKDTQKLIAHHQAIINKYKQYGSELW